MSRVPEQGPGFLEELFKPLKVGPIQLKNRIVMPAMGIQLADIDKFIDYYTERAKGGVGLIIVGCCRVRNGRGSEVLYIGSDDKIIDLAELAESIHEWGAGAIVQLFDHGMALNANAVGQRAARGVDQFSLEEIEDIVESFATAAVRAKVAGFDGVEIHGAHGYLVAQFFSPLTNHRNDEYGGDLNRRAALALAVVRRVRERVGNEYLISFRLSGSEYIEGGLTIDEAKVIARLLEREGVDILHVSAGKRPESFEWAVQPMAMQRGCLVPLAQAIKESVSIPVIAVGRINDPILANQVLVDKKADLVAMGRALLADPEMPKKAFEQRFEDIRKCIACMVCHERNWAWRRARCAVNAALGREAKSSIHRTDKPRKVLVVGGGLAGLEATRVLTLRGHDVTLYDKRGELGGQALLAARPPHKEELLELIRYLTIQIEKLGVKVELGREVNAEAVISARPDVVVIATGGRPIVPNIKGIDLENVRPAQAILEAEDGKGVGDRVVIIGGGLVGCETAEFLAERAKDITIVEARGLLMENAVHPLVRELILERLAEQGVKVYPNSHVREVKTNAVIVDQGSGSSVELPADTVVLAVGPEADTKLADGLMRAKLEVYAIGECTGQDGVMAAIHDGFRIGCSL